MLRIVSIKFKHDNYLLMLVTYSALSGAFGKDSYYSRGKTQTEGGYCRRRCRLRPRRRLRPRTGIEMGP